MNTWHAISAMFEQGGVILILIAVMSVLALGVGLDRWYAMTAARRRMSESTRHILANLRDGKLTMARAVNTTSTRHPGTTLFAALLDDKQPSSTEIRRRQARILRGVRRGLWVVGSIGATAPFVGLLGTVLGVMESFHRIGVEGAGGFQVVSGGISEALITTAGGILVGVEAVILFNFLQVRFSEFAAELKEATEEILEGTAESARVDSGAQAG